MISRNSARTPVDHVFYTSMSTGANSRPATSTSLDARAYPPLMTPRAGDPDLSSRQPSSEQSRTEDADEQVITSAFAIEAADANGFYLRYGKRAFDLAVSGALLLFLSPLFIAIAIAIRLDSPGSAIYRCRRLGHRGVPFRFWKFRSMVTDAHVDKDKYQHMNEVDGPVFKVANDPRMTRVGRFLRRSSLDELPQLVHVFRGQMTLVGPRPPEPDEVLQYEPWQLRRLSVRPGLTCLWQISGRSLLGFEEWMKLDLEYVDNRSFRLDLLILLRTIPAVLSGRGAF